MATQDMSALHTVHIGERDDFKVFPGIGPGVENRLHAAGIITYQQLAALSPDDIARILSDMVGFSVDRIIQQDWIGQARHLVAELHDDNPTNQQHYAVFTLELLLDKDNIVRRTRVMHVQSQQEETWAGWDDRRLIQTYIDQAGLHVKSPAEWGQHEDQPPVNKESPAEHQAKTPAAEHPRAMLSGKFCVLEMDTQTQQPRNSRWMLPRDQPIILRLKLDLRELQTAGDTPLNYSVIIYSKAMSTGSRLMVGSSKGRIMPGEDTVIEIDALNLSRGIHRLEAFVMLAPPAREPQPDSSQVAFFDGGLFQVY